MQVVINSVDISTFKKLSKRQTLNDLVIYRYNRNLLQSTAVNVNLISKKVPA